MTTSRFDFGRIAEVYDAWYDTPVGRAIDEMEKRGAALLLPRAGAGERMLEVGCGTGHWSAFFASRGWRVTGMDVSAEMLARARARDIPEAWFVEGDAHHLAFDDESFDAVVAVTALEFVNDYRRVLEEMYRCLKPGGVLLAGVLNRYSYLGVARRLSRSASPYRDAHFFSHGELGRALARFGRPVLKGTTFLLPQAWALPAAGALEAVGRLVPWWGNFLVGAVVKENQ